MWANLQNTLHGMNSSSPSTISSLLMLIYNYKAGKFWPSTLADGAKSRSSFVLAKFPVVCAVGKSLNHTTVLTLISVCNVTKKKDIEGFVTVFKTVIIKG